MISGESKLAVQYNKPLRFPCRTAQFLLSRAIPCSGCFSFIYFGFWAQHLWCSCRCIPAPRHQPARRPLWADSCGPPSRGLHGQTRPGVATQTSPGMSSAKPWLVSGFKIARFARKIRQARLKPKDSYCSSTKVCFKELATYTYALY